MNETKICSKCGGEFPATLAYFYACKRTKSGLRASCRECHLKTTNETIDKENKAEYLRRWRENNPEKVRAQNKRSNRNKIDSGWWAEYYAQNKDELNKKRNKWLKDTGKGLEYVHRRRAFVSQGNLSKEDWDVVVDICNYKCVHPECGENLVTIDHVIPLSKGGKHCICNVQPLCKSHNSKKQTNSNDYRPKNLVELLLGHVCV